MSKRDALVALGGGAVTLLMTGAGCAYAGVPVQYYCGSFTTEHRTTTGRPKARNERAFFLAVDLQFRDEPAAQRSRRI